MTEKTIGQLNRDTFCSHVDDRRLWPYSEAWEAAATAVWNEAVEACLYSMFDVSIPKDWATTEEFQDGWARATVACTEKLQPLKCSHKD